MDGFMEQDIFFFVTTAAVVVLTILVGTLAIYMISVIRRVNYISKKAKKEVDLLSEELTNLRGNIKSTGFRFGHLLSFFSSIIKKKRK